MYHVFLPVLFQFATMGFRVKDDEDWWDLGRAAILGPLNALVIVGDWGLETLFDTIQGKPWAGEDVGNVLGITKIIRELAGIVKDLSNSKTEKTRAKYWKKLILEMSTLTGIPSHQIDKLINNYEKVLTGDTDGFMENLLRLLNYSEHAIYGLDENTKKKKKDKKKKKIDSRTTEGLNIPTIDYQDNTLDDDLNRMEEDFKKKQEEMMLDFNF